MPNGKSNSFAEKIALIFPGLGYNSDKPLLYYAKRLARSLGYTLLEVKYGVMPEGSREDKLWMESCIQKGLLYADEVLCKDLEKIRSCKKLVCITKSIGSAVAAAWCKKEGLEASFVVYTPIPATFAYPMEEALVFHGESDPWFSEEDFKSLPSCAGHCLYTFKDANHSLESGDMERDLSALNFVISKTKDFISR